jgi:putrescine aminotransferase
VLDLVERYMNPGLARAFRFMGLDEAEASAEGVWVTDTKGRRYLDFSSGYGVMVHGYRHPRLVAAARAQLDRLTMSSRVLPNLQAAKLAQRLAEVTPGRLTYSFLCNSGAEAVEAALKFARLATGRKKVVTTEGAFHGKTFGALSASGRDLYKEPFRPLLPDVVQVPYGDLEAASRAVDEDTALFFVEPIQGEGGVVVPPDGYLTGLRRLTRAVGALFGVDEVQTGMGRTGYLWAFLHEPECDPDLLTAAKALGGGIVPLGALLGTQEVFAFLDERPLIHSSTFGGNPLAAAVGLAAIDTLAAEALPERARELGARLRAGVAELCREHPRVLSEVRGRGLMLGLEATSPATAGALMAELLAREMLVVYTLNNEQVLRLMPPLVISEAELEEGLARLRESLSAVDALVDALE